MNKGDSLLHLRYCSLRTGEKTGELVGPAFAGIEAKFAVRCNGATTAPDKYGNNSESLLRGQLILPICYNSEPMPELARLLTAFVGRPLSSDQLQKLQAYLDLLLKWNAKINLTAVRNPEDIIRRHFGESLFAGEQRALKASSTLTDVGSGAGFPGLPIKILAPHLEVSLVESQQKKATFLREVIRALELQNVSVYAGRAEELKRKSQIVTMRAVEKFESALPTAASLVQTEVQPKGSLALLIGSAQAAAVHRVLPGWSWQNPIAIPDSRERVLLVGVAD